ncbi:putative serine/threonine-protein kinase-like protein CCR3 isoform X2 [Euphorbia lathyris]
MAQSLQIEVEQEAKSSEKTHSSEYSCNQKLTSLESIFLIMNFLLELPSAVFDQLSSVHKPQFALLSMLMSFTVLIISVTDLVYKGTQKRVSLMNKGLVPWFYHPYPNSKPFGTFPDIIGLVCAVFQWIFASIGYAFVSRNTDNPVKVSTWPIFFAFGLLYTKLSGNLLQTTSHSNLRKLHRAEAFTLAELAAATNDFSADNKIGSGRFCVVYKGRLQDGREVAIKRRDISQQKKIEDDNAFESELVHLSRLHHKHLVGLVGYCEQGTERLLVFDYMMKDLYSLLFHKDSSINMIDSWVMRIRIALDAARGIDYLHNYAVPPIIHRAIKSCCILLDTNLIARISDFEPEYKSKMAAERDGYVDPEYNGGNVLTAKSDVYSFGVVLLELLTGKTAIFNNRGKLINLVEFAVPKILGNELPLILDHRIGSPESANEAEAIEMVAYTAVHCVNPDGINRPTITSIVNNLDRALSLLSNSTRTIEKSR